MADASVVGSSNTLGHVEKLFSRLMKLRWQRSEGVSSSLKRLQTFPCGAEICDETTIWEQRLAFHEHWVKYIEANRENIGKVYQEDGNPAVFATIANNGVNVCCYRWAPAEACSKFDGKETFESEEALSGSTGPPSSESGEIMTEKSKLTDFTAKPLLKSNNWSPIDWSKCKGVFFFLHGIGESARFSLLRLKHLHLYQDVSRLPYLEDLAIEKICEHVDCDPLHAAVEEFEGGWADSLTRAGFVVYGMDLQGHGLSSAWKGTRCNVDRFQSLIDDAIEFLTLFIAKGEIPRTVPVFLAGLSMGGCVAARTCQIGFSTRRLKVFGETNGGDIIPALKGVLFFCPALSAERLKKQYPNRIFVPFLKALSALIPQVRAARLASTKKFAYFTKITKADPLCNSGALPIRISAESLTEMDLVIENADLLPENLAVKILQSKYDTMTDPEGSKKFVDAIRCTDKDAEFLDYSWHFLGKEPGYSNTIDKAIDWMLKRCCL